MLDGPLLGDTGPARLVKAWTSLGCPKVVKMLDLVGVGSSGEAAAVLAVLHDTERPPPEGVPIVNTSVLELIVPANPDKTSSIHPPGTYHALKMTRYVYSLGQLSESLSPEAVLAGVRRMVSALEWIHSIGFVHMDVKVGEEEP